MRLKSLRRLMRIVVVWTIVLLMTIDTAMACRWFMKRRPRCCVPAPCYTTVIEYPAATDCHVPVEAYDMPPAQEPGVGILEAPSVDHQADTTEMPYETTEEAYEEPTDLPAELAAPDAEPVELPEPDILESDDDYVADDIVEPADVPEMPLDEEDTSTKVDDLFGEPEEPALDQPVDEPAELDEMFDGDGDAEEPSGETDDLFGDDGDAEEPSLDEMFDGDGGAEEPSGETDDLFGDDATEESTPAEADSADFDDLFSDIDAEEDAETTEDAPVEDLFDGDDQQGTDEDETSLDDLFNQKRPESWSEAIVDIEIEAAPLSPLAVARDTSEPVMPLPTTLTSAQPALVVTEASKSISPAPIVTNSSEPPMPKLRHADVPKYAAPVSVMVKTPLSRPIANDTEATSAIPSTVARATSEPSLPAPPAARTINPTMVVAGTAQPTSPSPVRTDSSAPPFPARNIAVPRKSTSALAAVNASGTVPVAEPSMLPVSTARPMRTWVDNTGLYSTRGRLVEVRVGEVRLLKENGRHSTVPLRRLSRTDRAYVLQIASQLDDNGITARLAER